MPDALLLLLAVIANLSGVAWLALAMDVHWEQVRAGEPLAAGIVRALRVAGAVAIFIALLLCLRADHATMAALVWVMTLTGSAVTVAFALAWRPALLAPFVAWVRR